MQVSEKTRYHPIQIQLDENQARGLIQQAKRRQEVRRFFVLVLSLTAIVTAAWWLYAGPRVNDSSPTTTSGVATRPRKHGSTGDYNVLLDWMIKGGAKIQGAEPREVFAGGGRGLFATRDFAQGDTIFEVPSVLWLSEINARIMSPVSAIIAQDSTVTQFTDIDGESWALALLLEYEKYNPYSFWKPYIQFIPEPPSPIGWDEEEIALLQSGTLIALINRYRKYINDTYTEMMDHVINTYPAMFSAENNTLDSFYSSVLTAWTRSYDVRADGEKYLSALVPFGDMLNHKNGVPQNRQIIRDKQSLCGANHPITFIGRAPRSIGSNDEITISYSDTRATASWIVWAAFVPEYQYGDYIWVRIPATALPSSPGQDATSGEASDNDMMTWVPGGDGWVADAFVAQVAQVFSATHTQALLWIASCMQHFLDKQETSETSDRMELAELTKSSNTDNSGNDGAHNKYKKVVILSSRIKFKSSVRQIRETCAERATKGVGGAARVLIDALARQFVDANDKTYYWEVDSRNEYALAKVDLELPFPSPEQQQQQQQQQAIK